MYSNSLNNLLGKLTCQSSRLQYSLSLLKPIIFVIT